MAKDSAGYRSKVLLPKDMDGFPVQVLSPNGANAALTVPNGSSDRVALPTDAEFVRIACTVDAYVAFGDVSVVASATTPLFPKGVELMEIPIGATYIAAFGITASGLLSATRMGAPD
jgi:hypothetical protein